MSAAIHYLIHSSGPKSVTFYDSNFGPLHHTVRLNGYPHGLLQDILSEVCCRARQEGVPVEMIHHRLDNSMQGIILPDYHTGVIGFDAYDPEEPNLLAALHPEETAAVLKQLNASRQIFAEARALHNEQETIYVSHMDFAAADRIADRMISQLLDGHHTDGPGREIHRYFGAATVSGNLDYIPEDTMEVPRRILIKGRPGTGKSTFLRKIGAAAVARGYQTEIYHCSLDPDSLDMVIVRELGFCLLDSTAPHEYFPSREGDEILDLYRECVEPGTDEANAEELRRLQGAYKELVIQALSCLREAKAAADRLDALLPQISGETWAGVKTAVLKRLFS